MHLAEVRRADDEAGVGRPAFTVDASIQGNSILTRDRISADGQRTAVVQLQDNFVTLKATVSVATPAKPRPLEPLHSTSLAPLRGQTTDCLPQPQSLLQTNTDTPPETLPLPNPSRPRRGE